MSSTAEELNKGTRSRRESAAKGNPAVVDLEGERKKTEAMHRFMCEQADAANTIALEVKALNEQRKVIFDEVEAKGIDRKAFKDMLKLRKMETDERVKYEASRRQLVAAFGFESGEQLDIFDPLRRLKAQAEEDGTTIHMVGPDGEEIVVAGPKDLLDAPGGDVTAENAAAIAEHIAKHGTRAKH